MGSSSSFRTLVRRADPGRAALLSVRFGSVGDINESRADVRKEVKSGHHTALLECRFSATSGHIGELFHVEADTTNLVTNLCVEGGLFERLVFHMSPSKFQPVAADDVTATLAEIAIAQPKNGVVELAGPEASSMAEFIQSFLSSVGDERKVITDPDAKYFGAILVQDGLAPSGEFIAGPTRFADWIRARC